MRAVSLAGLMLLIGCTESQTLSISFEGDGVGSISSNGAVICEGGPAQCTREFPRGTVLHLTATPAADATFAGWAGACSGMNDCELPLESDQTLTARFESKATHPVLHVRFVGAGHGTVSVALGDRQCTSDCDLTFEQGQIVAFTATADADSVFEGWAGACTGDSVCSVELSGELELQATFRQKRNYAVRVTATGSGVGEVHGADGAILCGDQCTASVLEGSTVVLDASADSGSLFEGWGGPCSGLAQCTFVVTGDAEVSAEFVRAQTLKIAFSGQGTGRITSSDGQVDCATDCEVQLPEGSSVDLAAVSDPTSSFRGYQNACVGQSPACTLSMSEPREVNVRFVPAHIWSSSLGPPTGLVDVFDVATDSMGNVLVAGAMYMQVDFGSGPLTAAGYPPNTTQGDAFIAKYTSTGALLWVKQFGDAAMQGVRALALDSLDNIYIAVATRGEVDFGGGPLTHTPGVDVEDNLVLAKFKPDGSYVAQFKPAGANSVRAVSLARGSADQLGLIMEIQGTAQWDSTHTAQGASTFGPGVGTTAVVQLRSDLTAEWVRSFSTTAFNSVARYAPDGSLYFAAVGTAGTDFGCGVIPSPANGATFAVRLSTLGTCDWSRSLLETNVTSQTHSSVQVEVSPDGQLYWGYDVRGPFTIAGTTTTSAGYGSLGLVKMDPQTGTPTWVRSYGETNSALYLGVSSMAVDDTGGVVLAAAFTKSIMIGDTSLTSAGGWDLLLMRSSPLDGAVWSARRYGSATGAESWMRIARGPDGSVVCGGDHEGGIDFGGGVFGPTSYYGNGGFVALLNP